MKKELSLREIITIGTWNNLNTRSNILVTELIYHFGVNSNVPIEKNIISKGNEFKPRSSVEVLRFLVFLNLGGFLGFWWWYADDPQYLTQPKKKNFNKAVILRYAHNPSKVMNSNYVNWTMLNRLHVCVPLLNHMLSNTSVEHCPMFTGHINCQII